MGKEKISIGIPAHKEEKNIYNLLCALSCQALDSFEIEKIIVVVDGSPKNTLAETKRFKREHSSFGKKITILVNKRRKGKWVAINRFLKGCKTDIVVMSSADIIPKEDCLENLCLPLKNRRIGITGVHPTPRNCHGLIGGIVELEWALHHEIASRSPKFGEMIAFRRIFSGIQPTAVDEEEIARLIKNSGFLGEYAENALVFNEGPKSISDFIKQRRRIYCGHLELRKAGYSVPTGSSKNISDALFRKSVLRYLWVVPFAAPLEIYSRILGAIDFVARKSRHYRWEMIKK